jgi:hypothetical protein
MRSGRCVPAERPGQTRGDRANAIGAMLAVTPHCEKSSGGDIPETGDNGALARSRATTSVRANGLVQPSGATALSVGESDDSGVWQCSDTSAGERHSRPHTTPVTGNPDRIATTNAARIRLPRVTESSIASARGARGWHCRNRRHHA